MAITVTGVPAQRKVCKYYNEVKCSHDNSHEKHCHVYSFCAQSGKNMAHPET